MTHKQHTLVYQWAEGTSFNLDITDSAKRQFNILAKMLGWVGGEEPWNTHWKECFDQDYIWRASTFTSTVSVSSSGITQNTALSSDSATSTPRDGDNSVPCYDDDIWTRFKGFKPNPTSNFNVEFSHLARYQRWTRKVRHIHRIEIFDADFQAHYGNDIGDIYKWQELCRLCSIDPVPKTIPACVEALEEILVNIYDVLDHQRTGAPIIPYNVFKDFTDYTFNGRVYPLERAKEDTFMPVFLKVLYFERGY